MLHTGFPLLRCHCSCEGSTVPVFDIIQCFIAMIQRKPPKVDRGERRKQQPGGLSGEAGSNLNESIETEQRVAATAKPSATIEIADTGVGETENRTAI